MHGISVPAVPAYAAVIIVIMLALEGWVTFHYANSILLIMHSQQFIWH